ncbi:MAG: hypothetical protein M1829_004794 [Trizodia sp. TS-e1964]|nr:MAG: hypothetical protein M1829_004794 [Trizodia sp. TS-e1964]
MSQQILEKYSSLLGSPSITPEELLDLDHSVRNLIDVRGQFVRAVQMLRNNDKLPSIKRPLLQLFGSDTEVPMKVFQKLDWKSKILCVVAFRDMKLLYQEQLEWICLKAPNFAKSLSEDKFFGTNLYQRMVANKIKAEISSRGNKFISEYKKAASERVNHPEAPKEFLSEKNDVNDEQEVGETPSQISPTLVTQVDEDQGEGNTLRQTYPTPVPQRNVISNIGENTPQCRDQNIKTLLSIGYLLQNDQFQTNASKENLSRKRKYSGNQPTIILFLGIFAEHLPATT